MIKFEFGSGYWNNDEFTTWEFSRDMESYPSLYDSFEKEYHDYLLGNKVFKCNCGYWLSLSNKEYEVQKNDMHCIKCGEKIISEEERHKNILEEHAIKQESENSNFLKLKLLYTKIKQDIEISNSDSIRNSYSDLLSVYNTLIIPEDNIFDSIQMILEIMSLLSKFQINIDSNVKYFIPFMEKIHDYYDESITDSALKEIVNTILSFGYQLTNCTYDYYPELDDLSVIFNFSKGFSDGTELWKKILFYIIQCLPKERLEEYNSCGFAPIHEAILLKSEEITTLLIQKGVQKNQPLKIAKSYDLPFDYNNPLKTILIDPGDTANCLAKKMNEWKLAMLLSD
jgi:hypothetical protein